LTRISTRLAILTDADMFQSELSKDLFPGLPSGVLVHDGFRKEHEQSAIKVLEEVKRLLAAKNGRLVYTVSSFTFYILIGYAVVDL
jgi:hypothetical protein